MSFGVMLGLLIALITTVFKPKQNTPAPPTTNNNFHTDYEYEKIMKRHQEGKFETSSVADMARLAAEKEAMQRSINQGKGSAH